MRLTTRREWLQAIVPSMTLLAGGRVLAAQLPSQFFEQMRVCDNTMHPTPAVPAGAHFKPNAPPRASLIEPGVTGTKLVLSGQVVGMRCGPVASARLDFWQPDEHGRFDDTGWRLRGSEKTDDKGRYRLETIVPGADPGGARLLRVRVQPPKGAALSTALFFASDAAAAKVSGYNADLVLTLQDAAGGKTATFDFILDL